VIARRRARARRWRLAAVALAVAVVTTVVLHAAGAAGLLIAGLIIGACVRIGTRRSRRRGRAARRIRGHGPARRRT